MLVLLSSQVYAGFLDMPEMEEVPELKRKTLLMDVDIPSVRERDPDPQGGPRINVKEFRVQGIVEYPEKGITRAELIKRVEAIRFDIMKEDQILDSGYTEDEIAEVSDLLANIEEETAGEHVTTVDLQRLVFLIRDQRRKRGITLGMIESVADVITRYYRENGFILAKAFIPEQQVREGVVNLTLLLGELGEVEVNDNERYPDKIIERVFDSAMGEPITASDMEERLYLVNDLPGISLRGHFEPGTQVGDTKFNINTANEKRYNANVRLDNHGSKGSGENRLYADALIYNPTKTGDQLQIGLLGSFEPANTLYGMLRYQTNIVHPRLTFSTGASSNEFTLDQQDEGLSGINVSGKSRVYDISANYKLRRSRVSNHSVDITFNTIDSNASFGDGDGAVPSVDKVQNWVLDYNFDILNEGARSLHQGTVKLTQTSLVEGLEIGQKEDAILLNIDYSWMTFFKIPFTKAETRIMTRFSGSYVGAPIASSMQSALGGPSQARGFAVNEFYADDAAYLGVDWIFNGPSFNNTEIGGVKLSNMLQPYLFMDSAYGNKRTLYADNNDESDTTAILGNSGLGLRINFKGFRGSVMYSKQFKRDISSNTEEADMESKVYFDMQYSF